MADMYDPFSNPFSGLKQPEWVSNSSMPFDAFADQRKRQLEQAAVREAELRDLLNAQKLQDMIKAQDISSSISKTISEKPDMGLEELGREGTRIASGHGDVDMAMKFLDLVQSSQKDKAQTKRQEQADEFNRVRIGATLAGISPDAAINWFGDDAKQYGFTRENLTKQRNGEGKEKDPKYITVVSETVDDKGNITYFTSEVNSRDPSVQAALDEGKIYVANPSNPNLWTATPLSQKKLISQQQSPIQQSNEQPKVSPSKVNPPPPQNRVSLSSDAIDYRAFRDRKTGKTIILPITKEGRIVR